MPDPQDDWPDVDPRFRVMPRHLFGPFYSVRIYDVSKDVEVFVTRGSFLIGLGSVRRAARYATARYLRRDDDGRHESPGRAGY